MEFFFSASRPSSSANLGNLQASTSRQHNSTEDGQATRIFDSPVRSLSTRISPTVRDSQSVQRIVRQRRRGSDNIEATEDFNDEMTPSRRRAVIEDTCEEDVNTESAPYAADEVEVNPNYFTNCLNGFQGIQPAL